MKTSAYSGVACFLAAAGLQVMAADYHVARPPAGSNANPGTPELPVADIQRGIDLAAAGDTVIVAAGTYTEKIELRGKNIRVRSVDPSDAAVASATVISGNDVGGPVVTFDGTETGNCAIEGFTIRQGAGGYGGGISGGSEETHTHAAIRRNAIQFNVAILNGGGIAFVDGVIEGNLIQMNRGYTGAGLYDCDGPISNNTIFANEGEYGGGGLAFCDGPIRGNSIRWNGATWPDTLSLGGGLYCCHGIIEGNLIEKNKARHGGGLTHCGAQIRRNRILENTAEEDAGGVGWCTGSLRDNLIAGNHAVNGAGCSGVECNAWNNTVVHNSATNIGGGFFICEGPIVNCIAWSNTAPTGAQMAESALPENCCIQAWTGGGSGVVTDDPLFADPDGPDNKPSTLGDNDYRLQAASPCVDAGANGPLVPPGLDLDGRLRIARGPGGSLTVDIGAYEHRARPFAIVQVGFTTTGLRQFVLHWNSQPGDTYQVWRTYSLSPPSWHLIGTKASDGESTSLQDDALAPIWVKNRFYRVAMPQ